MEEKILEILLKIQEDVEGLKEDVAELKIDVAGLKKDVAELKIDVANLKEGFKRLEARQYVDSHNITKILEQQIELSKKLEEHIRI